MGDSWWDIKGDHTPLPNPHPQGLYATVLRVKCASSGAWRVERHAKSGSLLPGVSPEAWRAQSGEGAPVPLETGLYLQLTQGSPSSSWNKKQCPPNPSSAPAPTNRRKETGGRCNTSLILHRLGPCKERGERSARRASEQGPCRAPAAPRGTKRNKAATHPPEAPARGRGPPRAAGRSSSSPGTSPCD